MSEYHVHLVTDNIPSVHKGFQSRAAALVFARTQVKTELDSAVLVEDTQVETPNFEYLKRYKVLFRNPPEASCWLDPDFQVNKS